MIRIAAAVEIRYHAAGKIVPGPGPLNLSLFFVRPGSAVRKPQVAFAFKGNAVLRDSLSRESVVDHALQRRVRCTQAQIDLRQGPMNVNRIDGTTGHVHIALNIDLVVRCPRYRPVGIPFDVHIDDAVFGPESCIRILRCINGNRAAAIDRRLGTAGVHKDAVHAAAQVDIAVDDDGTADGIPHGARSVQPAGAVVTEPAIMAVDLHFQIAVHRQRAVLLNVRAQSIRRTIYGHIHIAVDGQGRIGIRRTHMDALCAARTLHVQHQFVRIDFRLIGRGLIDAVNRACTFFGRHGQRLVLSVDDHILFHIDGTGTAGQRDSGILGEFIGSIGLAYAGIRINLVLSRIARNGLAEFRRCLLARRIAGRRVGVVALAFLVRTRRRSREADSPRFLCCTRRRQAFGNLHRTGQVAIAVICVPQLVCELVQHFADIVLRIRFIRAGKARRNAVTVRQQSNSGTRCGIRNLEIAAVNGLRIGCIMFIDDRRIAAVVVNRNRIAVVLEDDAGMIRIAAAGQ